MAFEISKSKTNACLYMAVFAGRFPMFSLVFPPRMLPEQPHAVYAFAVLVASFIMWQVLVHS